MTARAEPHGVALPFLSSSELHGERGKERSGETIQATAGTPESDACSRLCPIPFPMLAAGGGRGRGGVGEGKERKGKEKKSSSCL